MEVKKKDVLIGVFVKKGEINVLLKRLVDEHMLTIPSIFIFEIEGNESEYLITFKSNGNKDILKEIPNSVVLHVKNCCLFSINALNKLIEQENGTLDVKYQLDWEKYKNKLIISVGGKLKIVTTKRIYLKNEG